MPDPALTMEDPRWGQEGRDGKAEAILATLELYCRRDLKQGLWLDIGCGNGGIAATLASHVDRIVGVDPESWNGWQAFRQQHPNLEFHSGGYRDLVRLLGQASIDVVICNQVYEHVDDPAALLREIHQVMKPDGICYFAGPNLLWPIEPHVFWPFVHWLPRSLAQRSMRALGSNRADDLDAWSSSYWKLARLFRKAGFNHINVIPERLQVGLTAGSPAWRRTLAHMPRGLATALVPLTPGFVFVLRGRDDQRHLPVQKRLGEVINTSITGGGPDR